MINFSGVQLLALAEGSHRRLKQDIARLLREDFPDLADDAMALDAFIDIALADARELKIEGPEATATYAVIAFLMGLEVKDDKRLRNALLEEGLSEVDKARWMQAWIQAIARALEA